MRRRRRTPTFALLDGVVDAQASLVARWMLVGFVHGVMNTDNMTISGESIDFGPCAFMDAFDPSTVFSSIDDAGRYAYGNQPHIALWNLTRLAETLLPLLDVDVESAKAIVSEVLQSFSGRYHEFWTNGMRAKLGLSDPGGDAGEMIDELLVALREQNIDFTAFFRALSLAVLGNAAPVRSLFPRSGVVRRVGRSLARRGGKKVARSRSNGAGDGSGQPGVHPSQPQGRGSAGCSDWR